MLCLRASAILAGRECICLFDGKVSVQPFGTAASQPVQLSASTMRPHWHLCYSWVRLALIEGRGIQGPTCTHSFPASFHPFHYQCHLPIPLQLKTQSFLNSAQPSLPSILHFYLTIQGPFSITVITISGEFTTRFESERVLSSITTPWNVFLTTLTIFWYWYPDIRQLMIMNTAVTSESGDIHLTEQAHKGVWSRV